MRFLHPSRWASHHRDFLTGLVAALAAVFVIVAVLAVCFKLIH